MRLETMLRAARAISSCPVRDSYVESFFDSGNAIGAGLWTVGRIGPSPRVALAAYPGDSITPDAGVGGPAHGVGVCAGASTTALEAPVMNKLTLVVGFGAGYVLGAKAGKERYAQIEAKFREIAGMPAVQNATSQVKAGATDLAEAARATVAEKAQVVVDKAQAVAEKTPLATTPAEPVVDLSSPTGAQTGAAPMAGAAASASAPDPLRP